MKTTEFNDLVEDLGKHFKFEEALRLFQNLTKCLTEKHFIPLALVANGDVGKVITHDSEEPTMEWDMVMCNAEFAGITKVIHIDPTEH